MMIDIPPLVQARNTNRVRERSGAMSALIVLAIAIAVALVSIWYNAASLFLLFAGILFASLLDACTRALAPVLPVARAWRLGLIVLILSGAVVLAISWGIVRLPEQARVLIRVMDAQIDVLQGHLTALGIEVFGPDGGRDFSHMLPDPGKLFAHVQSAVGTASGLFIDTIVIVCLGLFFAANPAAYRDGVVCLVPVTSRMRVRNVMDEMGKVLRSWLLGQLVRIAVAAVVMSSVLYWLGLPGALLLGLQAGIANFIPYLGPLLASVPVALVAMPLGHSTLIWAMAIYFLIQTIEGYILGPMIQRGAVNLPPAWNLLAIVILGAMFGVTGIALATPLLAVARIAVLRFYVEDCLGDRQLVDEES